MDGLFGILLGLVFVTPFVVVYFLIIRWCDRFEPEPWWLLLCAFFFGALIATFGGGTMNGFSQTLAVLATDEPPDSENVQFIVATFSAPIFEEGFKGLGVAMIALISALGVKELDGPLDGAIYGGVVGLGFTLTEDVQYVSNAYAQDGLVGFAFLLFVRTVMNGLTHCTFTAMTGLGFGIAAETRSTFVKFAAPVGGYVVAMILHGFHNGILALGFEGFVIMQLVSWATDIFYFVVLALLVMRDRAMIIRELTEEVGGLLHAQELRLITTYVTIGWRNWMTFFAYGWTAFRHRRRKQLALVEIAFLKNRRRRGETGRDMDSKEAQLRHEVAGYNRSGVWLGS